MGLGVQIPHPRGIQKLIPHPHGGGDPIPHGVPMGGGGGAQTLELCKTVENEFYNIKSRLHLGLFSEKILLLSSFALAAMIFQKFDHVVKTK